MTSGQNYQTAPCIALLAAVGLRISADRSVLRLEGCRTLTRRDSGKPHRRRISSRALFPLPKGEGQGEGDPVSF